MRITREDILDKIKIIETEITEEILTVLVLVVHNEIEQAIIPKNIVPDLE